MAVLADFNQPVGQQQRRGYNVKDQFGRLHLVYTELISGGMCGPAMCAGGWTDPISTPTKYVDLDPKDPNKLIYDYEAWALDLEQGHREWEQRYSELGFDRYGDKFDPEGDPTPYMLREVGPKPLDPAIPRAAASGDPKYLGFTPVKDAQEQELERLRQVITDQEAVIMGSAPSDPDIDIVVGDEE